jgi:hypothetical protein
MIQEVSAEPWALHWGLIALDVFSAVLGMVGTYFMSRRYAKGFLSGLLFAVITFFLYVFFQGAKAREFYAREALSKKEIPDSPADVAFGLNLLFVGFLAQLAKIVITALHGKA